MNTDCLSVFIREIRGIYCLLSEPSIVIEQLNADASASVDIVDPRAVDLGVQLTTKWWDQLYSRTNCNITIDEDRCAAATDFNRLGLGLK